MRYGTPHPARAVRWGWWLTTSGWVIVVLALSSIVACSSGDDDTDAAGASTARGRSESTESEATTTTYASVEDEIEARYVGYWEARLAANSPPNPDDPALREYATGGQLEHVIRETVSNEAEGVELRRRPDSARFQRVVVARVSGDSAAVQECRVDDDLVVRSSDGTVVDDSVSTHNVQGEMRRVDGEWRLAETTLVQRWDGVAGCALATE